MPLKWTASDLGCATARESQPIRVLHQPK